MWTRPLELAIAALMMLPGVAAAADAPRTAEAVIATDLAWGDAENAGDGDFVEALMLPDYRSVGATGKTTLKAAIVAGARSRSGRPTPKATVDAWNAAHPTRGEVSIAGDTAVLRWISTAPATAGAVSSSDIFVYVGGGWHAIYSQHAQI